MGILRGVCPEQCRGVQDDTRADGIPRAVRREETRCSDKGLHAIGKRDPSQGLS
jgi:hypothetical protein